MRYTTVAAVRDLAPDLVDDPDSVIESAILAAEDLIDRWTGCAWSTTAVTLTFRGDGSEYLFTPYLYLSGLSSCEIDGDLVDVGDIKFFWYGALTHPSGWPDQSQITLELEHGVMPTPEPIIYVANLESVRIASIMTGRVRSRNTSTQIVNEYGSFSLPNWSGKYGFSDDAEVIRILQMHRQGGESL